MSNTHEHPVLQAARQLIRRVGRAYALSPESANLLEANILRHRDDPELTEILRSLSTWATTLEHELDSREAARMLLTVLGRARLRLTEFVGALEVTEQERFQRAAEAAVSAVGSAVNKLQGEPPPGSLSVRSLNLPPMPQPWSTARKATTPKAKEASRPAPRATSRSSGPLPRRRFA